MNPRTIRPSAATLKTSGFRRQGPLPRAQRLGLMLSAACMMSLASASAATWTGYMNVFFQNGGSKGGYIFGSGWGVSDMKTNVATVSGLDQLTLYPNYNTYTDSLGGTNGDRAFWTDSGDGGATAGSSGNKWMEANTYLEQASISDPSATFSGTVDNFNLVSAYTAEAFIKVLDPGAGYATVLDQRVPLTIGGPFQVSANLSAFQGKLLQYGFTVSGLNANPLDQVAYGSVTATVQPLVVPEPSALLLGVFGMTFFLRRKRA